MSVHMQVYGMWKDRKLAAIDLAERFHEAYERLAPQFGYETREETRTFDPTSPNGKLMIAVCDELLNAEPEVRRSGRNAIIFNAGV